MIRGGSSVGSLVAKCLHTESWKMREAKERRWRNENREKEKRGRFREDHGGQENEKP